MKELYERNQLSYFMPFNNTFSGRNLKIEEGRGAMQVSHKKMCLAMTLPTLKHTAAGGHFLHGNHLQFLGEHAPKSP